MKLDRLTPMLEVDDLTATIAFYTDVLGFEVLATWPPDGAPGWAHLGCGDAHVMFSGRHSHGPGEEDHQHGGELPGALYCYAPDIDALYTELSSRTELEPPRVTDYQMKEISIRDPNGFLLIFGQTPPS